MAKTLDVTLSRAHKIAERLKDLMRDSLALGETTAEPTQFSARPAPAAQADQSLRAAEVLAQAHVAATYASAWASVRTAIARENHKRGIDVKLAELETLTKFVTFYKKLQVQSRVEGYLPSEMAAYTPESGSYGYNLTVNPLKEPAVAAELTRTLTEMQRRAIQISDEIAEANAPRVTLELPEAIIAEVTGTQA